MDSRFYWNYVPNVEQSARAIFGIELSCIWLPALAYILAILPVLFYSRYERMEPSIQHELAERRKMAALVSESLMARSPFVLESQADEKSGAIFFRSNDRRIRIDFFSKDVVRITVIGCHEFSSHKSHLVIGMRGEVKYALREDEESYTISSSALQIVLCKETGAPALPRH